MTRFALDTNILVYAEGLGDAAKIQHCVDIIAGLPLASTVIPVQVLGELTRVLNRKAGRSYDEIKTSLLTWSDAFNIVSTTQNALNLAIELSSAHQFSIWDAIIMAVAQENQCQILLSEDLQDGFHWAGITIMNPLKDEFLQSFSKLKRKQ